MNSNILVAGGLGYIGCHTVRALEKKYNVIVLDNLSTGHKSSKSRSKVFIGDISDSKALKTIFSRNKIEAIMHFSASSIVEESVQNPVKYYENNLAGTLNLLKEAVAAQVKYFIFSSTAAVYGTQDKAPITEDNPTNPINCYGHTKLAIEWMLSDFERAYGIKHSILRYFNAAGADSAGNIGEDHRPETHLIPRIFQSIITEKRIPIYGTNYPTPDGTCIRDYVHVCDLANAHVLALEDLKTRNHSTVFNVGNGQGYSVRQVIETARKITGKKILVKNERRRPGDPPFLVASNRKIKSDLGWQPTFGLEEIIETAWKWHANHPNGYVNH